MSRLKYYLLFLLNSPVENEWFQFRYVTRFRLEELIECGGGFLGAKQVLPSSRFSSTYHSAVMIGREGRREQPRGLSMPVLVAAGRQCGAPCRAHVDDVIFMALCAITSNNKRVGDHCRNIGRAFWHLPSRLRNVSFVHVYVSEHLPLPRVSKSRGCLQVSRRTSLLNEWTRDTVINFLQPNASPGFEARREEINQDGGMYTNSGQRCIVQERAH